MTFRAGWQPTSANQLIVESWHDGAFISAVAKAHQVPHFDYTAPIGTDGKPLGKSGFKNHIHGMLFWVNRGKVRNIVVQGDNDTDHAAALSDIRKAIQNAKGYPTPHVSPCQMADNGKVGVGILMLPATGVNGCLETRLLDSTITNVDIVACVNAWATCVGFPQHRKNNFDKFRLRSLLAATIISDPNITLSAIWTQQTNPIDPSDGAFTWIADFLKVAFPSAGAIL